MDTPEKKVEEKAAEPKKQPVTGTDDQKRRTGMLMLVAGGLVVLALGFSAGWLSRHETGRHFASPDLYKAEVFGGGHPMAMKHRLEGGREVNATDGTAVLHLSGVVTQVNGDTFTIAGNGTTKTVKTTGDTNYSVSTNKVGVNDSVSVKGSQSGDTFTATSVTVLNR